MKVHSEVALITNSSSVIFSQLNLDVVDKIVDLLNYHVEVEYLWTNTHTEYLNEFCKHFDTEEIIEKLSGGETYSKIAEEYGYFSKELLDIELDIRRKRDTAPVNGYEAAEEDIEWYSTYMYYFYPAIVVATLNDIVEEELSLLLSTIQEVVVKEG